MTRTGVIVLLVCAAIAGSACTRTNDGVPIAAGGQDRAARTSETVSPDPRADDPVPGVVSTAPAAPAGRLDLRACGFTSGGDRRPGIRPQSAYGDGGRAGRLVDVVGKRRPGGCPAGGTGEHGGHRHDHPDASGSRSGVPRVHRLLTRDATVSTVSVLPGEMCGYSGQKLMGVLSDGAQSVQYQDRIVHVGVPIGTTNQAYLIVVHVEAPTGNPRLRHRRVGADGRFEIGLP